MSLEDLRRELELERALLEELRTDKLMATKWTPKQIEFMESFVRERILSGGNQIGKSWCVLGLTAMHLEGRYYPGYAGRRYEKPVDWAAAGPTVDATRDNIVEKLFGPDFDGTGWLSKSSFDPPTVKWPRSIKIRHSSGGWSRLRIFSYDQGARRVQGRTLTGITLDESPRLDVVEEFSARLNATRGELIIGLSPKEEEHSAEVIQLFEDTAPDRQVIYYGVNDALWMSKTQRDEIIRKNQYNPYASATLHGIPTAKMGLVYTAPQESYTYDARPVHGPSIIGVDLPHSSGTFAAVRLVKDDGVWRVVAEWKHAGLTIEEYAEAVRNMGGDRIPVAWPHDGGRIVGDGMTAAEAYRNLGLNMLPVPAFMIGSDGKKHRSIVTVSEKIAVMLGSGELQVSSDCPALLRELVRFRWKEGKVGEKPKRADDHLHDALCKALMMAEDYAEGGGPYEPLTPRNSGIADYVSKSYNPLAGRYGRRGPGYWKGMF